MKNFLTLLLFVCLTQHLHAQDERLLYVYLNDGSILKITRLDSTGENTLQLALTDGTQIGLPKHSVWQIREMKGEDHILRNGKRIIGKGVYNDLSFNLLLSKKQVYWETYENRAGYGAHYARGYQFNRFAGVGVGAGVDVAEYVTFPVFLDFRGSLSRKFKRGTQQGDPNPNNTWMWEHSGSGGARPPLSLPFTYGLQVGVNMPVPDLDDSDDFEKKKSGWLVYPSIGLLFPSRRGAGIRFDFGYKFQHMSRFVTTEWGGWSSKEMLTYRNFAIRGGVIF
jgi:hypothetical protein